MQNKYIRFFIYAFFIIGVILMPVDLPKEKIKQMPLKSNVVSITLMQPPQKKKVLKRVIKKPKPKKKPRKKPRKKPKLIVKKIEQKTEPIVKKEPKIEQKQELEVKKEEIIPQKVEVKTEDDLEQKRELALAKQAEKTYYDTIYEVISQNKRYPKRARRYKKEGSVKVSFKVMQDGSIVNLQLIELSKHKSLNTATKKLFERLGSFPKPPNNLSFPLELSITINYKLRR